MEPNILRASPSSPPSPKERSGIHRSWSPKSPHAPSTTLQGPPLPVVTPSPGVPVSWGLSLRGYPTSGHPSLSGVPLPGPSGTRAPGHSPARLRGGARVNRRREPRPAARTEPTRTPCPAGPAARAGSDVHRVWAGGPAPVSAHVRPFLDRQALSPHPVAETAPWGPEPGERVASRHRFRWHSWES